MCLYPNLVQNPKYKPNKKNGGDVPHMQDKRVGLVPIKCGLCMECAAARSAEWKSRLLEEVKHQKQKGNFVTFTFNNESYKNLVEQAKKEIPGIKGYDLDNQVATIAVKFWRERWRKKTGKSPRHWIITELGHGETEHLHMHGIVWTDTPEMIDKAWNSDKVKYGYITLGDGKGRNYVNDQTIGYITKYITKLDPQHKYYKPIILSSNQPGIGHGYTNTFNAKHNKFKGAETKTTYKTNQGFEVNLNVYWRNKLYTEEEREALWIAKLDKGVQYIGGEKIDAKDAVNREKLLKYYQKISNRLGYGSPGNWEAKAYEQQRRELYQNKRIIEKKDIIIVKPKWEEREWKEPGIDDW